MKTYPEYTDSGVECLGMIPKGWVVVSLKHLVSEKITDGPHETPEFLEDGIPFISAEGVVDNGIDFSRKRGFISEELHQEYSKKCKPQRDDIFLVKSGSTTGKSAIVSTDCEFNIWSPICIIRSKLSKILPRYFFHSIQSPYFRTLIETNWSFGTQPNIGMGVIENLRLTVPPLSEQKQISEYLDRKTQQIDDLIEKTERKIELLKEQRSFLINQCVTKGLDLNVEMKDSGVEWIGEIPKGWGVWSVRHLKSLEKLEIQDGNHGEIHPKSDDYVDTGIPFVMSNNLINGVVDYEKSNKLDRSLTDSLRIGFSIEGDVLLSHKGSIGKVSMVINPPTEYIMLTPQVTYYRTKGEMIDKRYLFFFLQSKYFQEHLWLLSVDGSTRQFCGIVDQKNLNILTPPTRDQYSISKFLDQETSKIDQMVDHETKRIDLLKEYRQSLISNVVTGKIDVREEVIQ